MTTFQFQNQTFILDNTIKTFCMDDLQVSALVKIKKQILELFNVFLNKQIYSFSNNKLKLIKEKSNSSTADLFMLYNKFIKGLKKVQQSRSKFLNFYNQEGKLPLYQDILKREMLKSLKGKTLLIMEGFLFFNLEQLNLIKMAYEQNIEIYLIAKTNKFIQDDIYNPLLSDLNANADYITIKGQENRKQNSISEVASCLFKDTPKKELDDSILFIEPFVNVEEEFKFIINDIIQYLKSNYGDDKEKIKVALENVLAVMLRNKKDTAHFSELLQRLNSDIKLSFNEKSLLDFSLGKFIYNLYNIISDGINIETYKNLLFTQWKYNDKTGSEKYDDALNVFSAIEIYFKGSSKIEEWITKIQRLILVQGKIKDQTCLKFHPINIATKDTVEFLSDHLKFIKLIVDKISNFRGTINEHLENLKNAISNNDSEETSEIKDEVFNIINSINDRGILKIDAKYFGETLRAMIAEYEFETKQNDDELILRQLTLNNVTKFKRVYIPRFESGRYPHNIKKEFPFTKAVLNILQDKELGINHNILDYIENDFHYYINNFFDFTEDTIIFTQSEVEEGLPSMPSVYVEDIFSLYNKNIQYVKQDTFKYNPFIKDELELIQLPKIDNKKINLHNLMLYYLCPKMFYFINENQTYYSDEIALNIYASNVLYVKFFKNFVDRNKNKVFELDKTLQEETEKILKLSLKEIKEVFEYLSPLELNDIYTKTLNQIYYLYSVRVREGKFSAKKFSFDLAPKKEIKIKNYTVIIDEKLIIKNEITGISNEFDIYKGIYLLLGRSNGKEYDYTHYDELISQLELWLSSDDRMKLVDFALFKIDVQLSSPKYYNDGIERIKNVISSIESSRYVSCPNELCKFCKVRRSCRGASWGVPR